MPDGRATPYRVRYSTIVADPPWQIKDSGARTLSTAGHWAERHVGGVSKVPYSTMTVDEIAALPVRDLAAKDAHLYLWTINAYLEQAYSIARAWGFKPATMLTWCKAPRGLGLGGTFVNTTEYVLFCRRGSLLASRRWDSTWFQFKRPYAVGASGYTQAIHSQKPDGMLDVVEQVSPGPYLELFARRNRLGWDTWGNESLEQAEMPA